MIPAALPWKHPGQLGWLEALPRFRGRHITSGRQKQIAAMIAMIDRPLVFGTDTPAVMIFREHIGRFRDFLATRHVPFEAKPFQQNFELIRFPGLKHFDVEELLDQLHGATPA